MHRNNIAKAPPETTPMETDSVLPALMLGMLSVAVGVTVAVGTKSMVIFPNIVLVGVSWLPYSSTIADSPFVAEAGNRVVVLGSTVGMSLRIVSVGTRNPGGVVLVAIGWVAPLTIVMTTDPLLVVLGPPTYD